MMLSSVKVMHAIGSAELEGEHYVMSLNHEQFHNLDPEDPIDKSKLDKLPLAYMRPTKKNRSSFEVLAHAKFGRQGLLR